MLDYATTVCESGVFMVDMLLILIYTVMILWYMSMSAHTFLNVGSRKLQPTPNMLPFAL